MTPMLLQKLFWLLVTIAIVVPVHEYGHYRVAVACKVRVLRFSVGFGRVLWSRRLGRDGTEFALSLVPLGGYVKMLDEREGPVEPSELHRAFTRRPLWQRAAIVAAGPAANLLLAVLLYTFVQWHGVEEASAVASTPFTGTLAAEAGLRAGDRLLATAFGRSPESDDWQEVRGFGDVLDAAAQAMIDHQVLALRVAHPGETGVRELRLATDRLDADQVASGAAFTQLGLGGPLAPARVAAVMPGSAAALAGVQPGDLVTRIDGRPVNDAQMLVDLIRRAAPGGHPAAMRWELQRGAFPVCLVLTPHMEDSGHERVARAGITMEGGYERIVVRDPPLAALRSAIDQTWHTATGSLRMFGRMIVGDASLKNLSGPGTIADVATSAAHQGFIAFISFLAYISISLGILNLLPVPMLDGGTLLYYLFEGATGRPVSELWQTRLQYGGFLAILLLMSIALSNDVARHLGLQ